MRYTLGESLTLTRFQKRRNFSRRVKTRHSSAEPVLYASTVSPFLQSVSAWQNLRSETLSSAISVTQKHLAAGGGDRELIPFICTKRNTISLLLRDAQMACDELVRTTACKQRLTCSHPVASSHFAHRRPDVSHCQKTHVFTDY